MESHTEQKTINITGQNNKYQMKKLTTERNTESKKREVSKKWSFDEGYFNYDKQMKLINDISKMNFELKLQSLPNESGYWLDSGEFNLSID